ncbi:MAG: pilus assembly protein [Alphaproteobacteria bacterium]|nr:pilus assembly protein [Alphaproteobacteria bacterium]
MRLLANDDRGASAVEFALIAPFLLLLVAAILAYGSIFATSLSLQQLAAETARATIGGLDDTEREQLAEAYLDANETGYPMLRADHIAFEFDPGSDGKLSRVKLKYDMSAHPAYALSNLIPLPSSPISYTMIVTDGDGATS